MAITVFCEIWMCHVLRRYTLQRVHAPFWLSVLDFYQFRPNSMAHNVQYL